MHTLLLADDSVTIQRVIELTFADEDVEVVAVSDGDQAIERLDAAPPDIVLADVGMPGRNGYEVARYVKQSPRLSHIPVVLLTGAFEPVDEVRAEEVGCDGVLAKPFEPQLVIGRVKELLAGHSVKGDRSGQPHFAALAAADAAAHHGQNGEDLGNYFDRLDEAFSNLPSGYTPTPAPPPVPAAAPAPVAPPVVAAPSAPAPRRAPASAAEAFAALLAEEQNGPAPSARPTLPAGASATPATAPVNVDDLVEQVTRRVLERLSDRAVREATADIVSRVAERLVREEIDRIKAAIK